MVMFLCQMLGQCLSGTGHIESADAVLRKASRLWDVHFTRSPLIVEPLPYKIVKTLAMSYIEIHKYRYMI